MMAFDYHCADTPPTSEVEMSRTWHCVQTVPYMSADLSVDLSKFHYKEYFTCPDGLAPQETKDVGLFLFSLVTGSVNATQGSIWVDYVVELSEPQQDEAQDRLGGELGVSRLRSLNDCVGPRLDQAWPITNDGNWYVMIPRQDGTIAKYWQSPSWISYDYANGYVQLPGEWEHGRVDFWVRGLVQADVAVTLATIETYVTIDAGTDTNRQLLANSWASNCPWKAGVTPANYTVISFLLRKTKQTTPLSFRPKVVKVALGDQCNNLAANYFVSRLSESEYDDLVNAG